MALVYLEVGDSSLIQPQRAKVVPPFHLCSARLPKLRLRVAEQEGESEGS